MYSMDILKAFSLCDEQYPINIQGTIENPLFQAKQIGALLKMSNILTTITNYSNELKVYKDFVSLGGIQKTVFLTEAGLYRLLARSNKPIAEKFQLWMIEVLKEIRLTGQYKLKQQLEIDSKLIYEKAKREIHNKILQLYHNKNVVYICKLKDENDYKFIIKIGSTQNIKERMANISNTYGVVPILLDVFETQHYIKLEKIIHSNESIKSLYYSITKLDGIIARETFVVNEEQYKNIITLVNHEITKLNNNQPNTKELLELQIKLNETAIKKCQEETKKYELETILLEKKTELKQHTENTHTFENNISSEAQELENNEENNTEIITCNFVKRRFNTRSPKVFQYNKDNLELMNIYDCVIDVIRNIKGTSHSGLREASKANTIYKNCRWVLQDRDIVETPIPMPTVISSNKSIEYIAMIDIKRTKIMEVFASQRDAAESRNLAGFSTISRAIKQSSISSGHYWNFFDKCSQEMKDEFLSNNSLPDRFIKKNSKYVIQIDPITNKEIKIFKSITDVTLEFQLSHTTLKKVSHSNEIHKGYKWKIVTPE